MNQLQSSLNQVKQQLLESQKVISELNSKLENVTVAAQLKDESSPVSPVKQVEESPVIVELAKPEEVASNTQVWVMVTLLFNF